MLVQMRGDIGHEENRKMVRILLIVRLRNQHDALVSIPVFSIEKKRRCVGNHKTMLYRPIKYARIFDFGVLKPVILGSNGRKFQ